MANGRLAVAVALFSLLASSQFAWGFGGNSERGQGIFMQRCAMCHGPDGGGNDGMAVDFRAEWYRLAKSDAEIAQSLRNGVSTPGRTYNAGAMPPQALNDRDMSDVIAFLRSAFNQ